MITWLAYGKTGINVNIKDIPDLHVVSPEFVPGLSNPRRTIETALHQPIAVAALRNFVKPTDKIGIIFSDITRPTPNSIILPTILAELDNIDSNQITLFNSLGTHRQNTEAELRNMLGSDIFENYRIIQNDAFDRSTQEYLGQSGRGSDIWINKALLDCDVKILTGFIEPHFFAGFSGGGKAIMPGMGGLKTILANHDAHMIANPDAVWGITENNPIWEEIHEVADMVDNTFLVNVTLNKDKEITGVFAGDLRKAHAEGCAFVKNQAMVEVKNKFDIVLTSNSGYPLDLNLYQAIKGVSAAAQVIKEGGTIIIAAECWDGIPEHGLYGKLIREAKNPNELLTMIMRSTETIQDQWQAQIQAQIQLQSDIYVYSDNLTDEQIFNAMMKPCRNIEESLTILLKKYGPKPRVCILPEGPQTVPFVSQIR